MDSKIIIIIVLLLSVMAILFLLNKFGPSQIALIPLGLILFSLLLFSRSILIFLTILCLQMAAVEFAGIDKIVLQLRWVFFIAFCFYTFGDIFLGRTVRRIKSFDILAIVFVIYALLSSFYSPFPTLTRDRAITILLLYISVFWIIWKYAYDRGPEKVVCLILRAMWLVFIMHYLMIFIAPSRSFQAGRFCGIYGNPNGMGIISAMALPLALWQFLETRKKSALFLFFLVLAGLLLSGTRGAINSTVVALGYFIYASSKKYKPLVFSTSVSFVLIFIWIIETLIKQFFMVYIRAESIPILGGRLEIWPIVIDLIMNKPIFGYGFGVEDKLMALKGIVLLKHAGAYVHNVYLGMALQLGIVGLMIFFSPLFILLFKELFSKPEGQTPLLRYALRASLITGLIGGIYESFIYSVGNAVAFPFWITVMLLAFYYYQDKDKRVVDGMGT